MAKKLKYRPGIKEPGGHSVLGLSLMLAQFTRNDPWLLDGSPFDFVACKPNGVTQYTSSKSPMGIDWPSSSRIKHIPWIFLNRIVQHPTLPLFQNIKGMDLYDEQGALTDFYTMWRWAISTAIANRTNTIALDPEFYNDISFANIEALITVQDTEPSLIIARLEAIGAELADIASTYKSPLTIWSFFTKLSEYGGYPTKNTATPAYIFAGFLQRCLDRHYGDLILIDCAESSGSFGYCKKNLADMQLKIASWQIAFEPYLSRWPNLRIGATIAPWRDARTRGGYWLTGNCGTSEVPDLDGFVPLMAEMFQAFKYIYIYADPINAGYDCNDPNVIPLFNAAIREAMA